MKNKEKSNEKSKLREGAIEVIDGADSNGNGKTVIEEKKIEEKSTGKFNKFNTVKDSGNIQKFSTGAQRDCENGKGRFDLLPPYTMYRLARHYENGVRKYDDENWRKGIPLRRYLESAERHLAKLKSGMDDEDHASAVIWNIAGFIDTMKAIEEGILPKELDNYTPTLKYMPKKW